MYFGQLDYIKECLNTGMIHWEGIARNVEYLGLPADIKVFLGRWYNALLHYRGTRYPSEERASSTSDSDDDLDSDNDYDSDDDIHEDFSSCTSVVDMDDEDEM